MTGIRVGAFLVVGLICLLRTSGQALPIAAASASAATPAKTATPEDPLGRTTPFGTVFNFMDAATKGDFKTAAQYLNSNAAQARKEELARQLKYVIDRGLAIETNSVSREPLGEPGENGLPSKRQLVGTATVAASSIDINLERVTRSGQPPMWLFSSDTLKQVPDFAEQLTPTWIEKAMDALMPGWLKEAEAQSLPLARLIHILSLLLFAVIGTWVLSKAATLVIDLGYKLVSKKARSARELRLVWPARFLALLISVTILSKFGATFLGRHVMATVERVLVVTGVVFLALRITDFVSNIALRRSQAAAKVGMIAAIHLGRGSVKILLVIAGILVLLSDAGVNLSTLVAGLGIGGIALAFASQKTIENLFGTLTIVTDQPARIGDFCRIGEFTGTLESVGLRSSRIRTAEDTVLTVPNGQLASMTLDNISARGKILFQHTVGLSYSTTSEQLNSILEGIEELLHHHERVEAASARVRLIKFGPYSLDLQLFAYIQTRDWIEFLNVQQALLVRVLQIVEASGTSIASPSLYLAGQLSKP